MLLKECSYENASYVEYFAVITVPVVAVLIVSCPVWLAMKYSEVLALVYAVVLIPMMLNVRCSRSLFWISGTTKYCLPWIVEYCCLNSKVCWYVSPIFWEPCGNPLRLGDTAK